MGIIQFCNKYYYLKAPIKAIAKLGKAVISEVRLNVWDLWVNIFVQKLQKLCKNNRTTMNCN